MATQILFIFTPIGKDFQLDWYFSKGLKPPTRERWWFNQGLQFIRYLSSGLKDVWNFPPYTTLLQNCSSPLFPNTDSTQVWRAYDLIHGWGNQSPPNLRGLRWSFGVPLWIIPVFPGSQWMVETPFGRWLINPEPKNNGETRKPTGQKKYGVLGISRDVSYLFVWLALSREWGNKSPS